MSDRIIPCSLEGFAELHAAMSGPGLDPLIIGLVELGSGVLVMAASETTPTSVAALHFGAVGNIATGFKATNFFGELLVEGGRHSQAVVKGLPNPERVADILDTFPFSTVTLETAREGVFQQLARIALQLGEKPL